jgi:hypothetical protein
VANGTTGETTVTSTLCRIAAFAVIVGSIAIGGGSNAAALAFEDISGKWCGSTSSYIFTPAKLTVIFYADQSRNDYKINDYEYTDQAITVNWERDGEKLFTKFGEFNSDGKFMVQQVNTAGPRREFRRCS